jgi:hypothetical protein
MKCRYDVDDGCQNEAVKGSTYCALHPLDDYDFLMRVISERVCPWCGCPIPEPPFEHDCPLT